MFRQLFFGSVLLVASHASLAADNEPGNNVQVLDPVTVTGQVSTFGATKSDVPIVETARSLAVIPSDQFTAQGALTLDDTLGYTTGVLGDTFGYSTRIDAVRVRGLKAVEYLDNIQVLFGFYNTTRTEVYTLEQVEVLKGPASVLYGAGAPGGIVNAISKQAGRNHLDKELVITAGTFNRKEVATDLGFDLSGDGSVTGRVVALFRNSDTQLDFVNDDSLVFAPSITFEDDTTRLTALFNYTKRESDTAHQFLPLTVTGCPNSGVTISNPAICATASDKEIDTSFYAGDPNFNRYDSESTSLTLFGEQILNDIFSVEGTARYRDSEVDYRQSLISTQGGNPGTGPDLLNPVRPEGQAVGRSWYDRPATSDQLSVDARLRANFDTGAVSHDVLVGLNYQTVNTEINGASLLYPSPAAAAAIFPVGLPTTFNVFSPSYDGSEIPSDATFDLVRVRTREDVDTKAIYISDQISYGNFIANAGVRYDDIKTSDGSTTQKDDSTSYSMGALYKTRIGLNPYISYTESFLPVFGSSAFIPGGSTGQPLIPEEGKQTEIGIKYQPPGTPAYVTVALYDLEQTNLPDPLAFPGTPVTQDGEVEIKGLEIEGMMIVGDFQVMANLSLMDTENQFGETADYIPEQQASVWGLWAPSDGNFANLRIGAGIRYTGETESNTMAYLFPAPLPGTRTKITMDAYTVADALIGYNFGAIDLALNVRNLFNHSYFASCSVGGGCFGGEERTAVGTLTYSF
ncbi:MAG: TonB-dependent siderophore receptor [Pseudomonadales bacterium]|nr:TonB-dependent siderophore receptor [Pseudomonadales bacterium]